MSDRAIRIWLAILLPTWFVAQLLTAINMYIELLWKAKS